MNQRKNNKSKETYMEQVKMNNNIGMVGESVNETFWAIGTSVAGTGVLIINLFIIYYLL